MPNLTILGNTFPVSAPYIAGHVLTEAEAKTLNQVRRENIGNNFRADIKAAMEKNESLEAFAAKIAEYDAAYSFSMRTPRTPVDPVERETRSVAIEAIKGKLAKNGQKYKEWVAAKGEDAAEAKIEEIMAREEIIAEAKKRIKAKSKVKDALGDDLGL